MEDDRNVVNPPLPEQPTAAPPGSPEKVEGLAERASLWQKLWHPKDAAADPDSALWRWFLKGA